MTTQDTDLDISRYTVISKIGEGSFSKVYRVKSQESHEYYAAKVAKFMIDEDTKESEEAKSLFREVNLMSLFNHPSILKFIGSQKDVNYLLMNPELIHLNNLLLVNRSLKEQMNFLKTSGLVCNLSKNQ